MWSAGNARSVEWRRRAFTAAAVSWAIALVVAPFAASGANGGAVLYGFAYSAYAIGRIVCHQLSERSFHLWGTPLPVCARCTGIYAGAAIAAVALTARRSQLGNASWSPSRARVILIAALIPTAVTLLYEWSTGDMPAHSIRALAGAPIGAAVAWIIREVN